MIVIVVVSGTGVENGVVHEAKLCITGEIGVCLIPNPGQRH